MILACPGADSAHLGVERDQTCLKDADEAPHTLTEVAHGLRRPSHEDGFKAQTVRQVYVCGADDLD